MRMKLTTWILLTAVIGFATGAFTYDALPDIAAATTTAGYYGVLSDLLLRLVKMVIVSLLALGMGMLPANFFQPSAACHLSLPDKEFATMSYRAASLRPWLAMRCSRFSSSGCGWLRPVSFSSVLRC